MSGLAGSVVVVTGGAAGIGRALAIEAANRGANVMIGDVDDSSGTVAEIERLGGRAHWQHCDVGTPADISGLRQATLSHFGKVNLVCSNVGIGGVGALHTVPNDDFERILRVNVSGSYWMLRAFAEDLISAATAGEPAHIMFTGSEHSLGVPPTDRPPFVGQASVYTMCKHAILGIAAVARRDLAEAGVNVSILCPGWTATERLRQRAAVDPHMAEIIGSMGQEPAYVATCAFDGMAEGAHVIPTNPVSRDFVIDTHMEIINAMDAVAF